MDEFPVVSWKRATESEVGKAVDHFELVVRRAEALPKKGYDGTHTYGSGKK